MLAWRIQVSVVPYPQARASGMSSAVAVYVRHSRTCRTLLAQVTVHGCARLDRKRSVRVRSLDIVLFGVD